MKSPLETAELQAFVRTVERRSLSLAARELGVPRQTLARRLERLEERLGARLISRTTRKLDLTDAGATLYEHARAALESVQRAEDAVRQGGGTVGGTLRVSMPPLYDDTLFDAVSTFSAQHPALLMHVMFTSQTVDLIHDADVAFRFSAKLEGDNLIGRTLRRLEVFAVASPDYLATHPAPKTPGDLADHDCLVFSPEGAPHNQWPLQGGGHVRVSGVLTSNSYALLRDATRRGRGIALLPSHVAAEDVRSGRLVPVLADTIRARARLVVVHANKSLISPSVRAFVDAMCVWARKAATSP